MMPLSACGWSLWDSLPLRLFAACIWRSKSFWDVSHYELRAGFRPVGLCHNPLGCLGPIVLFSVFQPSHSSWVQTAPKGPHDSLSCSVSFHLISLHFFLLFAVRVPAFKLWLLWHHSVFLHVLWSDASSNTQLSPQRASIIHSEGVGALLMSRGQVANSFYCVGVLPQLPSSPSTHCLHPSQIRLIKARHWQPSTPTSDGCQCSWRGALGVRSCMSRMWIA